VAGTHSFPGELAYSMSKSAMDQMTCCSALELGSKGVRVNSVNPALILTEIQRQAGMTEDQYSRCVEGETRKYPLGRVGDADEVAHAIAFLASSSASFITGEHLHIDGGWHAACPH